MEQVSRDEAREIVKTGNFSDPALKALYDEKSREQKAIIDVCRAIDQDRIDDLKVCGLTYSIPLAPFFSHPFKLLSAALGVGSHGHKREDASKVMHNCHQFVTNHSQG